MTETKQVSAENLMAYIGELSFRNKMLESENVELKKEIESLKQNIKELQEK